MSRLGLKHPFFLKKKKKFKICFKNIRRGPGVSRISLKKSRKKREKCGIAGGGAGLGGFGVMHVYVEWMRLLALFYD